MIRLMALTMLLSSCSLVYDFDDLSGLPCRITDGCPTGYSCATSDGINGECVVPQSKGFEESCSRNIQCSEGMICDNAFCTEGQANCERLCRYGCDPSDLLSCASPNELCFPAREEGAQGQGFCQLGNCITASDCDAGDICVRDADRAKNKGVCTQGCDMLDTTSCGEGKGCSFWFGDVSQAACDDAGTLPVGSECNNGTGACVPGSICLSQPSAEDPNRSVCSQLCDPDGQRGQACGSPNPTCARLGNMNLGICSGTCDPLQVGQCGGEGENAYSCQPSNTQVWNCGADGSGCVCNSACDPESSQEGFCALGSPCDGHRDCPDGMLCSATAACRPICSLTNPDVECAPMPGIDAPTCRETGVGPTFGVCE